MFSDKIILSMTTWPPRFSSAIVAMSSIIQQRKNATLTDDVHCVIVLSEEEAYGPYIPEGVQEVPLEAFFIEGKLDTEHIYEGAVVPLMNADGERFNGTIAEIKEKAVVVDLNHPLAGKELTFEGSVVENRVATNQEIQDYLNSQGGCGSCGGCGGGDCGGSCGEGSCCGGCN